MRLRLIQNGPGFFRDDEGARQFDALEQAGQRLESLLARLTVRFPREDWIVVTFADADEATLAIYRALGTIRHEPPTEEGDLYARRQVFDFFDRQRDEIETQRSAVDSHRAAFTAAAQRVAGVVPPSEWPRRFAIGLQVRFSGFAGSEETA